MSVSGLRCSPNGQEGSSIVYLLWYFTLTPFIHSLIPTSTAVAASAPGEIVTAKGVIRIEVDLGYGYHYEALLEEAAFSKHE